MSYKVPLLVIAAATLGTSAEAQQTPVAELHARIDSLVSERVAADAFSGTILLARNGEVVYQRAAGLANRESGAVMRLDTRLQIASVTKLFTNIAIRQLEQAGKLAFSDTVGKFLPDYANPVVRARVTVEQLLRHRSGVGSFWNAAYVERRPNVRTVRDYLALFENDSLLFEPGTGQAYSNGGYVILGAIIEKASGKAYHDYLRDHVFRPAGMTSTVPWDNRVAYPNAAVGYTRQPGGVAAGDTRLAGPGGPRPGYDTSSSRAGGQLRLRGADGRELSAGEAREARARRANMPRRPNTEFKAGVSSPAGDHFSTVGDLLKLASALTSHRLLDSARTTALLGARHARGLDFRANGGGPGVNAEFSMFPSGDVLVVLSNYDPPAATEVAELVRSLLAGGRR